MKLKFVTTASDLSKVYQLERSLKYFGWDYKILQHEWKGYLDKLTVTYEYLKTIRDEYTHFLYSDSYDTFALAGPESITLKEEGIWLSCEKACYPHPELADKYPLPRKDSPWRYVNGGGWLGNIEEFIKMIETYYPTKDLYDNDQVYLTAMFLKEYPGLYMDYECEVFQTIGHLSVREWGLDYPGIPPGATLTKEMQAMQLRFHNIITGTYPVFIHGNGHTPMDEIYKLLSMYDNLAQLTASWQNTTESHKAVAETLHNRVNEQPKLKALRDYVEANDYGFGERCFYEMWRMITETLPANFSFLEIGVYKGQTLALIGMLAPKSKRYGITPLTGLGGFADRDYLADIIALHKEFKIKYTKDNPVIIVGLSTDAEAQESAAEKGPHDIIYIDGGHDYETAKSDVYRYSSFVKIGGYLVIDDCANKYALPDGYFRGIESVSRAVDELLPNDYYTELFNVGHNRVFKRVK